MPCLSLILFKLTYSRSGMSHTYLLKRMLEFVISPADNTSMGIREINNLILSTAPSFTVSENAPSSFADLIRQPTLVIWSGESDNTIFQDPQVNYAFRALHDALHLKTRIGFTPAEEMALGRIQANQYSGLMADLVYIEVAGQAEHYLKTGRFVSDQVKFTIESLRKLGYKF